MPTTYQVVNKFFPNVTEIVDATRNAIIEVTRPDVVKSNRKAHKTCAMAVACQRKFHLDGVIVSLKRVYLVKGNRARRFDVPESVAREIVSFDRGGEFSPGTYSLAKIPPATRMGASKDKRRRPNGKSCTHHVTTGVRIVLGSKMAAG